MISQDPCPSGDEQLLDQAIAEFLRSEAAGEAGDRQQWLDRYPACAGCLAAFFDDRERVDRLMMPVRIDLQGPARGGEPTGIYPPPHSSAEADMRRFRPEPPLLSSTRYRPLSLHARGGMGEIWLAEDERIGRKVAVKKLRTGRESQQARFLIEAQITGQLEHPSVVPLHDIGLDDAGQPFYIMKFIHGRRLKDAIADFHARKNSADWSDGVEFRRLLETFVSICNVVAYAHHKGVLHRDIKPENVMLGSYGETLVVDWGLAKVVGQMDETCHSGVRLSGSGSTATQDGAIVGSPYYMSPEGAEGHPEAVDQSSDVYLLGATLYEILTSRPPRQGSSSWELIDLALHSRPTSPRKLDPWIPRPLEAICMKAMAFDKHDRYDTPMALAEDVEGYLAGAPTVAYREPLLARAGRWMRRHRRGLLQAVAALCVLVLAGFALDRYHQASVLADREQARVQLGEFRRLADEAQYFAANSDDISERVPYYDPRRAKSVGEAALAIAAPWGNRTTHLPLPEERAEFLQAQYALLLLMAQSELQGSPTAETSRDALALLDQAQAILPPTRGYHQLRSRSLARAGESEAAEREQKLADDPATPVTAQDHFLAGEFLRGKDAGSSAKLLGDGQPDRHREHLSAAIEEFRQALALEPKHYWARFQLGRCLLALDRGPEAVETLSACIALQPTSPWAYTTRGLASTVSGRPEQTIDDLDRAVRLDPSFQPARLNRGIVHWLRGDGDTAIADFDVALAAPLKQRLVEAAYYRGQILLDRKQDREALADFSMVIAARSNFRPAYWFRAKAAFRLGNYQDGQSDLARFLALEETGSQSEHLGDALVAMGKALRKLGQDLDGEPRTQALTRAANQLQSAVTSGIRSAEAYQHLGAVRELLGSRPEAIASYSQGLLLESDNIPLRNLRGWAYSNERLFDSARADFAEALRRSPDNSEAHTGMGFVLAQLGDNDVARQEASAALLSGAENQLILHNVACIYGRLSDADPARKTEHENLALAALNRAASLARRSPLGPDADEQTLIRTEEAFPISLRSRPEFQRLLNGK
jgi:tetratricopeptide (TPR) repeat protein/tRNA A-37 threonylcarbamoyl transferase component Bud32